jgi:hypothetical protein
MAGPLDSIAAGLGDEEARAKFEQEQAIKQAAAAQAAALENARQIELAERAEPTRQSIADTVRAIPVIGGALAGDVAQSPQQYAETQLGADNDAAIAAMQAKKPGGYDVAGSMSQTGQSYLDDAAARAQRLSGSHVVSTPNQMYAPTQKFVGEAKAANTSEMQGFQAQQSTEQVAAGAYAQHFGEEYGRLKGAADAAQAVQQTRAEKVNAEKDALKSIQKAHGAAVETLQTAPPEDAGRYWASRTNFQKAMFAISAGLMAFGENPDPLKYLHQAIQNDIEEQRSNRGHLKENVGALSDRVTQQQSIYDQILDTVGDERAADLILENARWQEFQAKTQALAANVGEAAVGPQAQQLLAQMQKKMAANELELQRLAVNTPEIFQKRVSNITGNARDIEMMLFKNDLARAGKGEDAAYDLAGKTAVEDMKNSAGGGLEERKQKLAEDKFQFDKKSEFAKGKGPQLEGAIGMIDDYLKDYGEDVPGVTESTIPIIGEGMRWAPGGSSRGGDEGKREFDRRQLIAEALITNVTGAVASPEQVAKIKAMFSGDELSGSQIRQGLTEAKRYLELQRSAVERAVGDDAAAEYRGVDARHLPKIDTLSGGRTRNNLPSVQDEAEKLGGRLE